MTDVSLKEHIETILHWLDRLVAEKVTAIERATTIALTTLNERLAGMNEFRDTLKDQAARLATKDDFGALEKRLGTLELDRAAAEGRAKLAGALWGIVAGVAAAAAAAFIKS